MKTFLKIVLLAAALALPCAAQAAKNILVFGDSLSAGYGIARDDSWVSLLQRELASNHPQFKVVNASISGETTAGGVRRIADALRKFHPRIVILELGANDGLRGGSLADAEKNLDRIIALSLQAHAKVLLLGMLLPPNYGPAYTRQFREMYPRLARKHHVALVPFMLAGIPPDQFQPDDLHPNASAQPRIMHLILHALLPLLR